MISPSTHCKYTIIWILTYKNQTYYSEKKKCHFFVRNLVSFPMCIITCLHEVFENPEKDFIHLG